MVGFRSSFAESRNLFPIDLYTHDARHSDVGDGGGGDCVIGVEEGDRRQAGVIVHLQRVPRPVPVRIEDLATLHHIPTKEPGVKKPQRYENLKLTPF